MFVHLLRQINCNLSPNAPGSSYNERDLLRRHDLLSRGSKDELQTREHNARLHLSFNDLKAHEQAESLRNPKRFSRPRSRVDIAVRG